MATNHNTTWILGSNGVYRPEVAGNEYSTVTVTSATGTNSQTLLTGNPGYVLTAYGVQIDDISTIAVAGMISMIFSDSSFGTVINFRWYLPTTFAPKNGPVNNRVVNTVGDYWNNRVAGSILSFHIDTPLVAGSIRAFARYALVNFLG